MWKKAKRNTSPNPASHPAGFRPLPPLSGAIVGELGPVPKDSVPLEEFSPSVIEGNVGSELAMVDVDLIEVVVKRLTGSVLVVAALVVGGIVAEGLTRVVLEVTALVVVGIVVSELTRGVATLEFVGTGIMVGSDMGPTIGVHSSVESQENPSSQHPSPHRVDINGHGFEQSFSLMHAYPFSQQRSTPVVHLKYPGSHERQWGPTLSTSQVDPVGQHIFVFGQR